MTTKIIAITGASASGKTHFAQALHRHLLDQFSHVSVGLVAEDSYYHNLDHLPLKQREQVNYDHPDALEHDLLLHHLQELKAGRGVQVPSYDYTVHTRGKHSHALEPTHLLILEGILLLSHDGLRQHFDLSLYVDTPLQVCLDRRMQRDVEERGRSPESVTDQFEKTVRPMFHQFIEPSKAHAHLTISGEEESENVVNQVRDELLRRGHLAPLAHAAQAKGIKK